MTATATSIWTPKLSGLQDQDIGEDTRGQATVRACSNLGLIDLKTLNISESELGASFDAYYEKFLLYAHRLSTLEGRLEPYIMIPMNDPDRFDPVSLFQAFRKAYQAYDEPWMELWAQYGFSEYNLPQAPFSDEPVARAMLIGSEKNAFNEAGLYLTDMTVEEQVEAGNEKIATFSEDRAGTNLALDYMDPVSYILLTAIRLEEGKPPLDKRTFTRFIGMEPKLVDGYRCVPLADWGDGRLRFGGSVVDSGWGVHGVRFSVG